MTMVPDNTVSSKICLHLPKEQKAIISQNNWPMICSGIKSISRLMIYKVI